MADKIPGETVEKANAILLPTKSKESYDKEYSKFQSWLQTNNVETINETVLLEYFEEMSEVFSPSSLWTKYSMLKKTLLVNKNIDLSSYHKLCEHLKEQIKGYESKKSKVLSSEQVLKFLKDAPNKAFLAVKVAVLFGVFGRCRRQELVNILVDNVDDRGSVIVVTIPATKTDKRRIFTIIDENEMNSIDLIRQYMSLRPQCELKRFFLNYRDGRCTAQPIGKNTFGKIPCTIAKYFGLKDAEKYTGHGLRRTSATLLADSGASMTTRKRKITDVEDNLEDSMCSKNKISNGDGCEPFDEKPSISTSDMPSTDDVSVTDSDDKIMLATLTSSCEIFDEKPSVSTGDQLIYDVSITDSEDKIVFAGDPSTSSCEPFDEVPSTSSTGEVINMPSSYEVSVTSPEANSGVANAKIASSSFTAGNITFTGPFNNCTFVVNEKKVGTSLPLKYE
ncbi:uncharacterized protein LOC135131105 [Zophobas morio]|uniref:uncharacterized protein LOC135131105 n=1 Tax=Zophobas morio TaxID=2755281 RepID=UPI00308356C4